MFYRSRTAFKHPKCGGVIYQYEWPERTRFKCERCNAWANDLVCISLGLTDRPQPATQDKWVEDEGNRHRFESTGDNADLSEP